MIKKILLTLMLLSVGAVAAFAVVVSLQPDEYVVERTSMMDAAPEKVFAQVNDLQAWSTWTPWAKLDPTAKTTISIPSSGKGAKFTWSGNEQIGEGALVILDSRPSERVELVQAFVKPFQGQARMTFTFAPEAGGTKVTWRMDGQNDFLGKAMCLFANMDAIVGDKFAEGLANIKANVEK